MYLTARQTALLSKIMQTLAEPHEEAEIRTLMGSLVLELFQAQYYASYVWLPEQGQFGHATTINMDPVNLRAYEDYYQFHDPITPIMQRYHVGVRATDVMAHADLRQSEFFNDFLMRDGLYWGVNLYAWHRGHNLGDMRIWRDRRREDFSADDLRLLDMLQPAFVAALARAHVAPRAQSCTLNAWADRLTSRELETAGLVITGQPDKAIARELDISITTVRSHLKSMYRKLGVNSRTALAHKLAR